MGARLVQRPAAVPRNRGAEFRAVLLFVAACSPCAAGLEGVTPTAEFGFTEDAAEWNTVTLMSCVSVRDLSDAFGTFTLLTAARAAIWVTASSSGIAPNWPAWPMGNILQDGRPDLEYRILTRVVGACFGGLVR